MKHADPPVHESTLPAVLVVRDLAALLGTSVPSLYRAMKRRDWPFTELPSFDRKLRWSRDQVLETLADRPMRRSRGAA